VELGAILKGPMDRIPFRIKVRPEDFRVEEIADLVPAGRGSYRLYRLTKSGWNTTELLRRLAKRAGLPYEAFSYGGRKDRHALTAQLVTVGSRRRLLIEEEGFKLEPLGWVERPMTARLVRGNRFSVTVRRIPEEDLPILLSNLEEVRLRGIPNYFDDQRFGSYDPDRGFLVEKMIRGDFEEALKIALTLRYPEEKKEAKLRKHRLLELWWRWEECLAVAKTSVERRVFSFLAEHGADYVAAVNLLPREEVSLAIAAYQGHLWNEMASLLFEESAAEWTVWRGRAGRYVFPLRFEESRFEEIRDLEIPTPGPRRVVFGSDRARRVYEQVLERHGLRPKEFALRELRTSYFRSFPRRLLVFPEALETDAPRPDELYPGRLSLRLSFVLPRGSYATMLFKRLSLRTGAVPGGPRARAEAPPVPHRNGLGAVP